MSVSGQSRISFGAESTHAVDLAPEVPYAPELGLAVSWSSGTGAGQLERIASKAHALTGGTDTLDLNADFSDPTGVVAVDEVRLLVLVADAGNAGDVTVTFNTTNGWTAFCTGALTLKPGAGVALLAPGATGYAVTDGTGDKVAIAGTAADVLNFGFGGLVP